jgi:hypothetical protein
MGIFPLNEDDKIDTDVSQNARYNLKFGIVKYILTDLHFNFFGTFNWQYCI